MKKRGERLITVIRNNTDNTSINRTKITRKQKREGRQVSVNTSCDKLNLTRENLDMTKKSTL